MPSREQTPIKKGAIVVDNYYEKNRLFDLSDSISNRDNCLLGFSLLRDELRKYGCTLDTCDLVVAESADFVIFNDFPREVPSPDVLSKSVLLLFESCLIRPDNWDDGSNRKFARVLTWNDTLVDNKKYFKMNFPVDFGQRRRLPVQSKRKLCTLIAGNKRSKHPLELYSSRRSAIEWYTRNYPDEFEFWGQGWDKWKFSGLFRGLNRLPVIPELFAPRYSTYRGTVQSKIDLLSRYRFCICLENAFGIPGYITEKIIDCFLAGCVPVYFGPPNISDHIPDECYISLSKFGTWSDLHEYLVAMSEEEYNSILDRIDAFLDSDSGHRFSAESFARLVSINSLAVANLGG